MHVVMPDNDTLRTAIELAVRAPSIHNTQPRSWLRAGEATSAALVAAIELGLAACPLSQPLEIAGSCRRVRDDVLDGAAEPHLVIRLGWAPTAAAPLSATPRRNVDDVITHGDETPVSM